MPEMTLCLGEALVDLICERRLEGGLPEADAFVPHFGGAVANVALAAAVEGAAVALGGGAGEDAWGHWLRDRLQGAGVRLDWFELVPGAKTPVAIVTVDEAGEASYLIYGEEIATVVHALAERLEPAIEAAGALFISSNTMVGEREREATIRARSLALERGRHVLFDPNLRLHRWPSPAEAASAANACVAGALLVRANRAEATLMSGVDDPEGAAEALVERGAREVVVTLGPEGAIARGEVSAEVPGVPAEVVSTIGAGDVLTAMLVARLAAADFDLGALPDALADAVAAAAQACGRWGALD